MTQPSQSDDPRTVWDLKRAPWTDEPMFYPPGIHPAYWRYRETLRKLEEMGQETHEMAHYLRDQIASFEERESEAKALYDLWLRGRR